jgi:surface polysaccharide O-acyltransferase-like enzyme
MVKLRAIAGGLSLGIYLCHALFLTLLDGQGINYKLLNPLFSIPLTALVCFTLSSFLIFIISKIPVVGRDIAG